MHQPQVKHLLSMSRQLLRLFGKRQIFKNQLWENQQ